MLTRRVVRFAQHDVATLPRRWASSNGTPSNQTRIASSSEAAARPTKGSPVYAAPSRRPRVPPSPERVRRHQALAWFFASLTGGAIAFYSAGLYIAATQPCDNPQIALLSHQKDVAAVYDKTADGFDSEVGFSEWLMGVNTLRQRLARQCKGDVLEVSCGTGRNLGYYELKGQEEGGVRSVTFVDLSPQMIEVCRRKWDALYGGGTAGKKLRKGLLVRFLTGSALERMPLVPAAGADGREGAEKKYTTVFQTMGLCSTPSPAKLLQNMAAHLDVGDPEARILLLEHGRSYTEWLNRVLDRSAEKHADIHGCWFNRDIGALVEEAAEGAGLEVVRERRHHLGTTWVFELKPKEVAIAEKATDGSSSAGGEHSDSGGGWLSKIGWK